MPARVVCSKLGSAEECATGLLGGGIPAHSNSKDEDKNEGASKLTRSFPLVAAPPDDFSTLPLEPLFPGTELDRPPSSNKRPLATSPEQTAPALAFPRLALDGMGESDSFGSTSLHFGGRSVGMGKSLSSTSALSAPPPEPAQPTRKRLRRGAAREGSPASYITSPADSDQSSTPAITSPQIGRAHV